MMYLHHKGQRVKCQQVCVITYGVLNLQLMLEKVIYTMHSNFMRRKLRAINHANPVPPHVEQRLAKLIQRASVYQQSVEFIPGTQEMKATVTSLTDRSVRRLMILKEDPSETPQCCAYSKMNTGIPCLHGIAVLSEKYGASTLYKFIHPRHLTTAWKEQYEGLDFQLPVQSDVDSVVRAAKRSVVKGRNLQVPKALPPPRGRPVKGTVKRKKAWYERGPDARKKRSYSGSLCGSSGHTQKSCNLRQGDFEHGKKIVSSTSPKGQ